MSGKSTGGAVHERDALLQAAIDFIGTLTDMTPPPIEVAPPEVFAPFRAFVDRVQAITALTNAAAQPPETRDALGKRLIGEMLEADAIATVVCRQVAELPDRSSPEDWPEAMLVTHDELHSIVFEAVNAAQAAPVAQGDDADLARTIDQRDTAEGWADGLAGLIGKYFGQEIGEHSSAHNPWQEARDIIEEALAVQAHPAAPVALGDAPTQAARDVLAEVERATRKFPTWPTDPLHALAVLGEEFGELTKDMLQLTYEPHKTSAENVRTEAIQTAAMALRLCMSLDRYEYRAGTQHSQDAARSQAKEGGTP